MNIVASGKTRKETQEGGGDRGDCGGGAGGPG